MSTTKERALIEEKIRGNIEEVIEFVADQIAHLGARPEWSMEDNFGCTEGMAALAERIGLPSAGNQTDEALAFYSRAES